MFSTESSLLNVVPSEQPVNEDLLESLLGATVLGIEREHKTNITPYLLRVYHLTSETNSEQIFQAAK